MDWLSNALKDLKGWQIGTLVAVMLAAFGVTYGVYAITDASAQQKLEENQRLIPVQLGNLVNEVAINGSIVFSNKETLTFGSSGIVAEILVDEGQEVEQGQPLVRLDAETVAPPSLVSGRRNDVFEASLYHPQSTVNLHIFLKVFVYPN